jgi:hypothetical protein
MVACADWNMRPPTTAAERERMSTVEARHAKGARLMVELLARPWFMRMWVVQEVAVRHWRDDEEKVKLLVGHLSVPWFVISHAFGYLLFIRAKLSESYNRQNGLSSIAKAWKYKHTLTELAKVGKYVCFAEQLAMYLSRFTHFGATDQRDRLYSLLGLLVGNEIVPKHLAPDYSESTSDVFYAYTTWMLREGGCVDVLGLGSAGALPGCPSWVPNFIGRRGVFYRNLDDTNPVSLLDGDSLLEIEALPIGVVAATGRRCNIRDEAKTMTVPDASAEEAEKVLAEECRQYLLECEEILEKTTPVQASTTTFAPATKKGGTMARLTCWAKRASLPPRPAAAENAAADTVETPRSRLSKYFDLTFERSLMDLHWTTPMSRQKLYKLLMTEAPQPITTEAHPQPAHLPSWTYAKYIAEEFDGYPFFVCENGGGDLDFCRSMSTTPEPDDFVCLLRGSTKRYIIRRSATETA